MGSIYTQSHIFIKSNILARSYGKGSMKPNGFMGSKSGNTYHIMDLVGAKSAKCARELPPFWQFGSSSIRKAFLGSSVLVKTVILADNRREPPREIILHPGPPHICPVCHSVWLSLYSLIARYIWGQRGPTWGRQDPGGAHVGPMKPCYLGYSFEGSAAVIFQLIITLASFREK